MKPGALSREFDVECRVECGVPSVKVECRVWCVKCKVWSVGCGGGM